MLTCEAAGAGDAMERHFAASKQLSLDREQVRVRVCAWCALKVPYERLKSDAVPLASSCR